MASQLLETPLHAWHAAHGGRMVEFGGWSMPVQYTSIVDEHHATRQAVGLFDISHMGRLRFDGPGGCRFLDAIVTQNVSKVGLGKIRYSLVTNEEGGVLDDVLVYHQQDSAGTPYYLLVVNASNREKIVDWIRLHEANLPGADEVTWNDLTQDWAMIAVQGPNSLELLEPLTETELASMKYYSGCEAVVAGTPGIISRTGYTGEDGFELIVGSNAATSLWETLIQRGAGLGTVPAGLGCRDTLRLEAGMPLYGHELAEDVNPIQAGLAMAVDLDKGPFPGRDAIVAAKSDPTQPRRVGLEVEGKRIPREGFPVFASGQLDDQVGFVTSGTFAPTLQRTLAMAYVRPELGQIGTELAIDVRGKPVAARVVKLPFYRRSKSA